MADDHYDHPSNFLRLSNSEPDLTLQLSLGTGGGASSTPAIGGQAPMSNGAAGDDQKGKAIFIQTLRPSAAMKRSFGDDDGAAGRRPVMSWKKRAREFGNSAAGQLVMHDPVVPLHVLMPPPPPLLPGATSDSSHHKTAFRRAVSVVKSAIDRHRAAHNTTTVMAPPPPPKEFMMIKSPGHDHQDMISTAALMQTSGRKNVPLEGGAAAHNHRCAELHVNKHKLMNIDQYNLDAPPPRTSSSKSSIMMTCKAVAPTSSKNNMVIKSAIKVGGQQSSHDHQEVVGKKAKRVRFGGAILADQDEIERIIKIMPSVTTTGGLPNGRRIEGVLFKYLEGKVWIVCVCHGNLLSPEEFVQHAGGSDLTNAMKLIKVVRS